VEEHRVEVDVREVDALFGAVVHVLAREVAVQVHLAEADRVRAVVAVLDRAHRGDVALVADRGERADRGLDGAREVLAVHRERDVHRAQVARDVLADLGVGEVLVVRRRRVHLQDLAAEVRHVDPALDRVGLVHRVLEHDVRVARLELDLGEGLEELARVDLGLLDARVVDHLAVLLGDRDVAERHAVDLLDVVRREEVHVLAVLGELERDVGDDDAERQRLDADLLVGVLALGVEEAQDVGVVRRQVHRAGALARAELVGVAEAVFEQLHDGDDAGGLVLDLLDRRTRSRMFESSSATPPPRLDSCRAELMPRAIDSMLSSMRSRKQLTSSPRCALVLRNVGVAGWKRPEMISSTSCSASAGRRRRGRAPS
jgi:hypothetical protein